MLIAAFVWCLHDSCIHFNSEQRVCIATIVYYPHSRNIHAQGFPHSYPTT